jgi:hypothetical protein
MPTHSRCPEGGYSEVEVAARSEATLKRLLATPPDHKTKPGASPKKRGRPSKTPVANK